MGQAHLSLGVPTVHPDADPAAASGADRGRHTSSTKVGESDRDTQIIM